MPRFRVAHTPSKARSCIWWCVAVGISRAARVCYFILSSERMYFVILSASDCRLVDRGSMLDGSAAQNPVTHVAAPRPSRAACRA